MLRKKALIMNFQSRDSHSSPLFRFNHILKLEDKILKEHILFIDKSFNKLLPPIFKVGSPSALMFTVIKQSHLLLTRYLNHLRELVLIEKSSITIGAINSWNKTQHHFCNLSL